MPNMGQCVPSHPSPPPPRAFALNAAYLDPCDWAEFGREHPEARGVVDLPGHAGGGRPPRRSPAPDPPPAPLAGRTAQAARRRRPHRVLIAPPFALESCMFTRLWSALGRVADAVDGVADSLFSLRDTFQQANAHVRQRLELEVLPAPAPEQIPLLTAQAEAALAAEQPLKNGRRSKTASA